MRGNISREKGRYMLGLKKTMHFKDPVNEPLIEKESSRGGLAKLGIMNSAVWYEDPKRLVFTLARYKFVAKMLEGKNSVLEFGCGDGFGSRIVQQNVKNLTITDYDPYLIDRYNDICCDEWKAISFSHDFCEEKTEQKYEAIYSLDVVEHIPETKEDKLLRNIKDSLTDNGVLIVGMPSIESQEYASPGSKLGHINCKSGQELKKLMGKHFDNVFLFSMNDEVVHTGFSKMAHYLFVLCVAPKKQ